MGIVTTPIGHVLITTSERDAIKAKPVIEILKKIMSKSRCRYLRYDSIENELLVGIDGENWIRLWPDHEA